MDNFCHFSTKAGGMESNTGHLKFNVICRRQLLDCWYKFTVTHNCEFNKHIGSIISIINFQLQYMLPLEIFKKETCTSI